MWFHGGQDETVLFEFWETGTGTGTFIGSLIIIFIISFVYEALKFWRDRMLQSQWEKSRLLLRSKGLPSAM